MQAQHQVLTVQVLFANVQMTTLAAEQLHFTYLKTACIPELLDKQTSAGVRKQVWADHHFPYADRFCSVFNNRLAIMYT